MLPKQFFVNKTNIRPVNESADDIIMFRCISVLCLCVNKNDKKGIFCWRQYKNNIKPHLQCLLKLFHLGPY